MPLADQVEAAFVFGSVASGKASAASDVDLMIIGDADCGKVVQLLHPFQQTLGREINPKLYTQAEWKKVVAGRSAFVRDIMGKPKLFVIGGENNL